MYPPKTSLEGLYYRIDISSMSPLPSLARRQKRNRDNERGYNPARGAGTAGLDASWREGCSL